jgi:hypothetical protein
LANADPRPLRVVPQRIVHVGNFGFKPTKVYLHGVAAKLTNGWVRAGHHVISFSDRDVARWTSLFGHRKGGVKPANRILLDLCRATRPEVLALGHADVIRAQTVAAIREALPTIKILQWNVDPIFDGDKMAEDNRGRIRGKQAVVDATFISTAGPLLAPFAEGGRTVAFLPNPVDPALERGRNFEREDLAHDVFLAIGNGEERRRHAGDWRIPNALAADLVAALPQLSFSLHGVMGRPIIAGPAYEAAILACAAGLNFSRRNDVYLYSSDRIAHLAGNGLAVHIDRATGYGELFSEDQFAFYSTEAELIDNMARLKREPATRRAVAEAGWRRYFELFDTTIVAQYMLDVVMGTHDPARYAWPTVWRG